MRPMTPQQKVKSARQDASMALHSLQLIAEELKRSMNQKYKNLKGRYSANAMLVFNS